MCGKEFVQPESEGHSEYLITAETAALSFYPACPTLGLSALSVQTQSLLGGDVVPPGRGPPLSNLTPKLGES